MVCDCFYSTAERIFQPFSSRRFSAFSAEQPRISVTIPIILLRSFLFVGLINLYCKIFAKFDLRDVDVIKACKNIKVPVLLIHGKCDDFIPYQDSEEIYDNLKCKKEIHLFDKAQHGMSFLVESDRYLSILKEFLKKVK